MDREEILEKSRNEKNIEYERSVSNKTTTVVMIATLVMVVVIITLQTIFDKRSHEPDLILYGMLTAGSVYRGIKEKDKTRLICAILWVVALGLNIAAYISDLTI